MHPLWTTVFRVEVALALGSFLFAAVKEGVVVLGDVKLHPPFFVLCGFALAGASFPAWWGPIRRRRERRRLAALHFKRATRRAYANVKLLYRGGADVSAVQDACNALSRRRLIELVGPEVPGWCDGTEGSIDEWWRCLQHANEVLSHREQE